MVQVVGFCRQTSNILSFMRMGIAEICRLPCFGNTMTFDYKGAECVLQNCLLYESLAAATCRARPCGLAQQVGKEFVVFMDSDRI